MRPSHGPWHWGRRGPRHSLAKGGTVLCTCEPLGDDPSLCHPMPQQWLSCDNQKCVQTWPNVPAGGCSGGQGQDHRSPTENQCRKETTPSHKQPPLCFSTRANLSPTQVSAYPLGNTECQTDLPGSLFQALCIACLCLGSLACGPRKFSYPRLVCFLFLHCKIRTRVQRSQFLGFPGLPSQQVSAVPIMFLSLSPGIRRARRWFQGEGGELS